MRECDLAIIGSGPGGYVAGLYATRHNLNVCVIEKDLVGGTCLNRGCIPTKSMLHAASVLTEIKESAAYGIITDSVRVDFSRLIARKDDIVSRLRAGIETLFKAGKVALMKGEARLKSANTVIVSGEEIKARNIIIATGSRPAAIQGISVDEKDIYTSDGIFNIKKVPQSILIVGGGVIGCEFAALFSALGSKVTLVELCDRLLLSQSKEISKKLELIFKKKGIQIFTSSKIENISRRNGSLLAQLRGGGEIACENILSAAGRTPCVEGMGFEENRIIIEKGMIAVNEFLETSVKNIYAIGDCVAGPALAHKASYDAILACDNIFGKKRRVDYSLVPNCIWTDPEIASIGLREEAAKAAGLDIKIAKFPYLASGKAFLMDKTEGFIKMIGDERGALLGIEIFGYSACDLIGEAALAKALNANIADIAKTVHGHPTLSEIFQEAAHIFCGTGIHSV